MFSGAMQNTFFGTFNDFWHDSPLYERVHKECSTLVDIVNKFTRYLLRKSMIM
jgi:hypothetical protein